MLHAVSRTHQGRQREPNDKTFRSPLSAEFWRHCVLSGRTQRRACSQPERRTGNINLSKYFISSSGDRTHNQSVFQAGWSVPIPEYKISLHTPTAMTVIRRNCRNHTEL